MSLKRRKYIRFIVMGECQRIRAASSMTCEHLSSTTSPEADRHPDAKNSYKAAQALVVCEQM
jgi:hypothetical protein